MDTVFFKKIQNDSKELSRVTAELDAFMQPRGLGVKTRNEVNLVIEEALVNIIQHGFRDNAAHFIDVRVEVGDEEIFIRITDDGRPFNPLTVPRQDKSKPVPERIDGGLGIHLVRNIMRSMSYKRENENNIFEIWIDR